MKADIGGGQYFRHNCEHDLEGIVHPWKKSFAWLPVTYFHSKEKAWLKTVYRRKVVYTIKGGSGYEYGTIFDMLRDN